MAVRKIVLKPNKKLHTKCEKITEFGEETKKLALDLVDTVLNAKNPEGAGLASPQIGVLKRMLVARDFYRDGDNPSIIRSIEHVLVNPLIIKKSNEHEIDYEGCLSIPDTYVQVKRAKKIKVKAQDVDGKDIQINTSGFLARVIQHEIDHLNGILMTDKSRAIGKPLNEQQFEKLQQLVE